MQLQNGDTPCLEKTCIHLLIWLTLQQGKTTVYYGDFSGLAVKLSEDVSIEVLREKFATQHAIGVVGWIEIDSKVENSQKIAKLVQKTA